MIVVEDAGLRTTVQDLGRRGLAHLGVPQSGAADRFSMQLANALVGNGILGDPVGNGVAADSAASAGAAVLETTLVGPVLRFEVDAVAALTGAPVSALLDDEPAEFGTGFAIRAGQRLRIGRAHAGLRTYLAVAGGFDVPPVLGSRSTDTLSGLGPAALARGDVLSAGAGAGGSVPLGRRADADVLARVVPDGDRPVRVVVGPDTERFTDQALQLFRNCEFEVSPSTDRVGARLAGPAIKHVRDGETPTAGMVAGAIQVPPDGAPIVLLADHAVTGGYPVIAVVVSADLPVVAQARPGTRLRFTAVSVGQARAAWAAAEAL